MVANEEDYDIQQSQAKPNMGFGNYFEFAKERSSGRLGAGLGAGIGIWNLGISSLQGALGAGIGIWNLGISSLQGPPRAFCWASGQWPVGNLMYLARSARSVLRSCGSTVMLSL